jgi:putative membrane protein
MAAWFGGGWGAGPWIGILWLLFWAALVIAALYVLRPRAHRERDESAMESLANRYARGEIDEDEYRKRLRVLRER